MLTNQQSRAQANPVGPRQKAAPGLPSELPNSAVNSMGGLANGNWAQRRFTVLVLSDPPEGALLMGLLLLRIARVF